MYKKTIRFIPFIVIICFLFAGTAVAAENILWEVTSKSNTVYLQGSIHFLRSTDYPLHSRIEKAFEDSQVLVLEVDLAEMNSLESQQKMLLSGMLTDTTLKQCLGEEIFSAAAKKSAELGMDINMFNQLKPWLYALTLTALKLQTLGFDPQFGIDNHFYLKAKKAGRQIIGLETVELQTGLLNSLSAEIQKLLVTQTLEEIDIMGKEMAELTASWKNGDRENLEKVILKSMGAYPEVKKIMLDDRNRNWLGNIEAFLKDSKNYMVVVGAGHLIGQYGLVEMLKAKGYAIKQL